MYLHIGGEVALRTQEIVAILDARLLASEVNQQFLERAAAAGGIRGHGLAAARSVVVTSRGVYLSSLSAATLARRARRGLRPPYGTS